MFEAKSSIVLPQQAIKEGTKEVQIVYRLFLVNCYLLHGNIYRETEADRDRCNVYTIYVGGLVIN